MNKPKEGLQVPAAVFNKLVLFDPKQIQVSRQLMQIQKVSVPIINCRYDEKDNHDLLLISENGADCSRSSGPQSSIRVIIVEPWSPPKVKMIKNTLQAKQEIVGGFIEVVYPFAEQIALILNEEGKLIGLPLNRKCGNDILAGTFIICGLDEKNACFSSLSEEQIQFYTSMFSTIEIYIDPAVFIL